MLRLVVRKYFTSFSLILFCICVYAQDIEVELVCPENVTINCDSEIGDLSSYGKAMYRVGEEINEMEDQQSKKKIDDCGKGNIERIWRYKSEAGEEHKCSQFIYIGVDEKGKPLIKWPTKEVVVSWCDPSYTPNDLVEGARKPEYFEGDCNKMEHTYSDEIVYLADDCKEVHRNWVVHDWCYDSKNVAGNDGHYKFTQIIKFEIPNVIDLFALKDVTVEASDCEKALVDIPDLKARIKDCNRRMKITNDSPFADSKGKNASGIYPVGETLITYLIELECTKSRKLEQLIIVSDPCKEKAIIEEKELNIKLSKSFVRPNPFIDETEIILNNDISQLATLKIYKTNGQQVSEQKFELEVGMQRIRIAQSDLPLPGVYLYSVSVGDRTLEGRLIKIR